MDANSKQYQQQLSPAELNELKPRRKNFSKTVVVGNNGAVIDEAVWKAKVGNVEGRELNKALKREGMTPVKIFLKEQYEAAKASFYSIKHSSVNELHSSTIDVAFEQAGQPKVKRVENTLKSILPLFKHQPQAKTINVFKIIIKAMASAGVIENIQARESRRLDKTAKPSRVRRRAPVSNVPTPQPPNKTEAANEVAHT